MACSQRRRQLAGGGIKTGTSSARPAFVALEQAVEADFHFVCDDKLIGIIESKPHLKLWEFIPRLKLAQACPGSGRGNRGPHRSGQARGWPSQLRFQICAQSSAVTHAGFPGMLLGDEGRLAVP